jgi:hypothetical protein
MEDANAMYQVLTKVAAEDLSSALLALRVIENTFDANDLKHIEIYFQIHR